MKFNRLLVASVLGLAFLATSSALACEHNDSSNEQSHWSFLGWCQHFTQSHDEHHRECDQNGQDSGIGRNCDRGKGNGGGYCGTDGHTSGGGSDSGGGSSTAGGGKGIS